MRRNYAIFANRNYSSIFSIDYSAVAYRTEHDCYSHSNPASSLETSGNRSALAGYTAGPPLPVPSPRPPFAEMEGILRAVHPAWSGSSAVGQEPGLRGDAQKYCYASSDDVKQQLATIREIKDVLVGNEEAKAAALRLGVVDEVLTCLDAAAAVGHACPELALLQQQAMGLLAVLGSSSSAQAAVAAAGTRIVGHITRALRHPSERMTALTLRAFGSLSACLVSRAISSPADAGEGETLSTSALLSEVSAKIVDEVTSGESWSSGLRTLGVEALAAVTRDEELAKTLVPAVVLTGTALLRPLLPAR